MRLLSSLLLWLCLGCAATAQINPNQPAPKPKPSTGTAKPAGPKQFSGNSSILVVFDADCTLKVDNEVVGNFLAGDMWKSPIMAGTHIVECSMGSSRWKETVECKSGQQLVLETKLGSVRGGGGSSSSGSDPFDRDMVHIAGGSFTMGCTGERGKDCGVDEQPAHGLTVSSYYLSKYEVTQAQWEAVMGTKPSYNAGCDQCPVEGVSWDDVQEFLRKLNAQSGKRYRLPTEAEWEYAARGGVQSRGTKYAGDNDLSTVGWYDGNSRSKTQVVGQKAANELGLYDVSGNVMEWCHDRYSDKYYVTSPQMDPQGPSTGESCVVRGGCWYLSSSYCRVAHRTRYSPDVRVKLIGFRLARTL